MATDRRPRPNASSLTGAANMSDSCRAAAPAFDRNPLGNRHARSEEEEVEEQDAQSSRVRVDAQGAGAFGVPALQFGQTAPRGVW